MVRYFPDLITRAKFHSEIFWGYDSTRGRISNFPIIFALQCSATALPVIILDFYCAAIDETRLGENEASKSQCEHVVAR